jgi:hypothetical protein
MNELVCVVLLSAMSCAMSPEQVAQDPVPAPKAEAAPAAGRPVVNGPVVKEQLPPQEPKPAPAGPQSPGEKPKPVDPQKVDPQKPVGQQPAPNEPPIERPADDQPIPRGTDPADIAAMRSAEAMLAAERKLAEQIKSGKIQGLDKILPFDELSSWPYEDGLKGMPKRIKELSGKKVLMTGFMLPIDEVQNIKEFLLVQSLWSCCYGQPPDIHGIVRVVMPKGRTTDYFFDPLKVIGTFKVESTVMEGYCVDIYQLHVESLETIK